MHKINNSQKQNPAYRLAFFFNSFIIIIEMLIIFSCGKQYLVNKNVILILSNLNKTIGEIISLDALDVNDITKKIKVNCEVLENFKGKKIYSFKKNRRKGYSRKIGYRDYLTKVRII